MEEELEQTSEGQNRLNRAKDRLDTKVAEIGQAEIDKQTKVDEVDPANPDLANSGQTAVGMEDEDDVAELFGNFDDAP